MWNICNEALLSRYCDHPWKTILSKLYISMNMRWYIQLPKFQIKITRSQGIPRSPLVVWAERKNNLKRGMLKFRHAIVCNGFLCPKELTIGEQKVYFYFFQKTRTLQSRGVVTLFHLFTIAMYARNCFDMQHWPLLCDRNIQWHRWHVQEVTFLHIEHQLK